MILYTFCTVYIVIRTLFNINWYPFPLSRVHNWHELLSIFVCSSPLWRQCNLYACRCCFIHVIRIRNYPGLRIHGCKANCKRLQYILVTEIKATGVNGQCKCWMFCIWTVQLSEIIYPIRLFCCIWIFIRRYNYCPIFCVCVAFCSQTQENHILK